MLYGFMGLTKTRPNIRIIQCTKLFWCCNKKAYILQTLMYSNKYMLEAEGRAKNV
jgi:hypothetical protein